MFYKDETYQTAIKQAGFSNYKKGAFCYDLESRYSEEVKEFKRRPWICVFSAESLLSPHEIDYNLYDEVRK